MPIDTDRLSTRYRDAAINIANRELLLTDFRGTEQEPDLTEPANCNGVGRIRHFHRHQNNWIPNPLPIDPACGALGLARSDILRAQVFQNAVCNWRCWYCFVPFDLLSANAKHARWVTPTQLIEWYRDQPDPPPVIDLTGGQPDLTPEWVPWMMHALIDSGIQDTTYLWSDDNLSNDYFWRHLSADDIRLIQSFQNYGRVACFKGFDAQSFAFNTAAAPELFAEQFTLFNRFISLGIDLYAYTTFTGTLDAVQLADLGARLLDAQGPRSFIDDAISTLGWDGHSPLIIEGIRHTRILDALLARFPHMRLAYVTASNVIRDERLKARDDLDLTAITALGRHSTETEVSALEARACWTVDGTDAQNAVLVIAREVDRGLNESNSPTTG